MKLLTTLSNLRKRKIKALGDHKQEVLVRLGREQFSALVRKGISVPVVLL